MWTFYFKKFLNETLNNIKNIENKEKDIHFTFDNYYILKIFDYFNEKEIYFTCTFKKKKY